MSHQKYVDQLLDQGTARLDKFVAGDEEFHREFGKYHRGAGADLYDVAAWLRQINIKILPGSTSGIIEAAQFVRNFAPTERLLVGRVLQFASQILQDGAAPAGDATLGVFRLMCWRYLTLLGFCDGP